MTNVDRVFWIWQEKFGMTNSFTITRANGDKGVQPKYGQGPSPHQTGNEYLNVDTKLYPFTFKKEPKKGEYMTTKDLFDINDHHYRYHGGSLMLLDINPNENSD